MSTSNFANKNASKVFAVELADEWSYDDLKDNLRHELDLTEDNFNETNENRSYPSQSVGYIEKFFNGFSVRLYVIIRSGYSSGVNLDWETQFRGYYDYYDDFEDFKDFEVGKIDSEIIDTLEGSEIQLVTETEKVFELYSTPLNCVGVFSNGEAIYEKA
jgi:hypothetical protein